MEAVAACLKIFIGLALVHFQKYWLLSTHDHNKRSVLLRTLLFCHVNTQKLIQISKIQICINFCKLTWWKTLLLIKSRCAKQINKRKILNFHFHFWCILKSGHKRVNDVFFNTIFCWYLVQYHSKKENSDPANFHLKIILKLETKCELLMS